MLACLLPSHCQFPDGVEQDILNELIKLEAGSPLLDKALNMYSGRHALPSPLNSKEMALLNYTGLMVLGCGVERTEKHGGFMGVSNESHSSSLSFGSDINFIFVPREKIDLVKKNLAGHVVQGGFLAVLPLEFLEKLKEISPENIDRDYKQIIRLVPILLKLDTASAKEVKDLIPQLVGGDKSPEYWIAMLAHAKANDCHDKIRQAISKMATTPDYENIAPLAETAFYYRSKQKSRDDLDLAINCSDGEVDLKRMDRDRLLGALITPRKPT